MSGARPGRRARALALAACALAIACAARPARCQGPPAPVAEVVAADTSLDGRLVLQVRATPGDTVEGPVGTVERTELWVCGRDGGNARRLLRGGERVLANETPMAGFSAPALSPDGRWAYVLSSATVTSDRAVALEIATGRTRELCGANDLRVVRRGPHAGDLVIEAHDYRRGGGAMERLWRVSPTGRRLQLLGDPDDPRVQARVDALVAGRGR